MSKVAQYLQEHLTGEVTVSPEARRHFAYDASILRMAPAMVVYPRTEDDVRKTARFSWQLAERERGLPITARGGGSDTSGAAIGGGILLAMTAHMNRILALDPKKEFVTVEPGVSYDKLQQTLYTHGLFLPVYPASASYATLGGGIANNAVGEKSVKYGDTLRFVQNLRVVLANGEIIETGPLSKRELNRKMGQSNFEGEVYRALDKLLEENASPISNYASQKQTQYVSAGYNLDKVKTKDGFNLTPLFVGSQGSLGIITEASLKVVSHTPTTTLAMVSLNNLNDFADMLPEILNLKPSLLDMVNKQALEQVSKINPSQLHNALGLTSAAIHLFIEFDEHRDGQQKKDAKNLIKLVDKYGGYCKVADTPEEQQSIWKVRHSVSSLVNHVYGPRRAVPVAEDIAVPIDRLVDFMRAAEKVYVQADQPAAIWGQAGSGIVRMHPILDLAQVGDRQKLFKIQDTLYAAALKAGGSISAGAGDGRVRAPYLRAALGDDMYKLILTTKRIFDPHNLLNPGVKTANTEQVRAIMRSDYSVRNHEHLPRS
ncbi:MAG TPA: FAD-binding oxidoreductase [Candidatus Saccharimonadales bacterium]|nr:FAD-binding oxidoreductase [Candidatus Saccharimonadales bacterium]